MGSDMLLKRIKDYIHGDQLEKAEEYVKAGKGNKKK